MADDNLVYAKDYPCCQDDCEEQAVAFWPMVDPDIPHHPYCQKHLDEAKHRVFIELLKIDSEWK